MGAINFFNSVDFLEPHCPGCDEKIDYGVNTQFNTKDKCHVCLNCGHKLD